MPRLQRSRPDWLPTDRIRPNRGTGAESEVPPSLRIGWRGVLLIVGFWTFFGIVMAASLFLSPLRQSQEAAPAALVAFTFLGAYTWAALTLPLFWLTRRLNLSTDGGSWRPVRIAGLVVFSLVLAIGVSSGLAYTSSVALHDLLGGSLAGPEGMGRMFRYRFLNDLLACHLVLTAGVARDYFFRYRVRHAEANLLRAQLVEARLEVLRTQLNPHFLFNTLNGVAALVTRDPRGVRRMLARLSELLRYALEGASEPEVPLGQELEMLKRYVEIMEIRFRDRLETRIEAAPELLDAMVPNLILQPLVENAVKHGVSRARSSGFVEVEAGREGEDLVLTVRDSGPGRAVAAAGQAGSPGDGPRSAAPDFARGGARREGGFGLSQTRERLSRLYGGRGRLALTPLPDGGVRAEVRLPYHTRPVPRRLGLAATVGSDGSERTSEEAADV